MYKNANETRLFFVHDDINFIIEKKFYDRECTRESERSLTRFPKADEEMFMTFMSEPTIKSSLGSVLFAVLMRKIGAGGLGTLLSHFAGKIVGGVFNSNGFDKIIRINPKGTNWFKVFEDHEDSFEEQALNNAMRSVFNMLLDNSTVDISAKISPFDLTPLMFRREHFMKSRHCLSSAYFSVKNSNLGNEREYNSFGRILSVEKNLMIKAMLLSMPLVVPKGHENEVISALFPDLAQKVEFPLKETPNPNLIEGRIFRKVLRNPNEVNFAGMPTDNGVCAIINLDKNILGLDSDSQLLRSLNSVYGLDTLGSIKRISGTGSKEALELDLKFPTTESGKRYKRKQYRVSINDKNGFVDNKFSGFDVQMGHEYTFNIKPTKHTTSKSAKDLKPETRNCRLSHETISDKSMFASYSQRGCIFECRRLHAYKNANCTPWHYPTDALLNTSRVTLCDSEAFMAFEHHMGQADCSHCLADCEYID